MFKMLHFLKMSFLLTTYYPFIALFDFAVEKKKEYRSKGLGYKMMLMCIEYIKSINIQYIMLLSNINSNAFKLYQSLGFAFDPIIKIDNPNYILLLYYTY